MPAVLAVRGEPGLQQTEAVGIVVVGIAHAKDGAHRVAAEGEEARADAPRVLGQAALRIDGRLEPGKDGVAVALGGRDVVEAARRELPRDAPRLAHELRAVLERHERAPEVVGVGGHEGLARDRVMVATLESLRGAHAAPRVGERHEAAPVALDAEAVDGAFDEGRELGHRADVISFTAGL
jgi:hypothetical protein